MNNPKITLAQISELSKSFELDFDQYGYLRHLARKNDNGCALIDKTLPKNKLTKYRAIHVARLFLNLPLMKEILHTNNFDMKLSEITPFAFGYRLTFNQTNNYFGKVLAIRGGAIHLAINSKWQIFSLSSTLQHGNIAPLSKGVISKSKAITLAVSKCKQAIVSSQCKLMLVAHCGQLEPLYEITLGGKFPYKTYTYLILANTGKIIAEYNKKFACFKEQHSKEIKANAFLSTPDPELTLSPQISKTIISDLPDSQVLKNEYFEMFTGAFAKPVRAQENNTYCYGLRDPEFAAVSVFISLQKQIKLYLELGLRQPSQPMFVVVNDYFLRDNAYFDPQRYEIHIGMGSGVKNRGLTKNIAFDLGVANHEFGHAAVYLQVPGGDLVGKLGEAINEAIGDVLGSLVMDYLERIKTGAQGGQPFTLEDLQNDSRIIGKYALPPFGIRSQKNNTSLPGDLSGEPHADGLIIGSALADLLVALAGTGGSIEKQIKLFAKLTLMALALLPSYRVNFSDMLRALIIADKEICCGINRPLIEECFAKHGIVLDTIANISLLLRVRGLAELS